MVGLVAVMMSDSRTGVWGILPWYIQHVVSGIVQCWYIFFFATFLAISKIEIGGSSNICSVYY